MISPQTTYRHNYPLTKYVGKDYIALLVLFFAWCIIHYQVIDFYTKSADEPMHMGKIMHYALISGSASKHGIKFNSHMQNS